VSCRITTTMALPWGSSSALACSLRYELLTAFSYTGSPKTEQGGDNQARHVVLTLESGISLLVALFPVKKSQKSQKLLVCCSRLGGLFSPQGPACCLKPPRRGLFSFEHPSDFHFFLRWRDPLTRVMPTQKHPGQHFCRLCTPKRQG